MIRWRPPSLGPHSAIPGLGTSPFPARNPGGRSFPVTDVREVPKGMVCVGNASTGEKWAVTPGSLALEELHRRVGIREWRQFYVPGDGRTQREKEIQREKEGQ